MQQSPVSYDKKSVSTYIMPLRNMLCSRTAVHKALVQHIYQKRAYPPIRQALEFITFAVSEKRVD